MDNTPRPPPPEDEAPAADSKISSPVDLELRPVIGNQFNIKAGRPKDFGALFSELNDGVWKGDCYALACGPEALVEEVQANAAKYKLPFHKETFFL